MQKRGALVVYIDRAVLPTLCVDVHIGWYNMNVSGLSVYLTFCDNSLEV